jgi:hypothetical protein
MKKEIIAATFVSNTKYYQYPIELWKQGLKDFETKVFECRKVQKPRDIATIQNECLEELFKDYHNVLWVQADLIFIPKKKDLIMRHLGLNVCYKAEHIKRYYRQCYSHYGLCLVNKGRFVGDGAYMKSYNVNDNVCAICAGYFGEANYRNHTAQQVRIWNQKAPKYQKDMIVQPTERYKHIFDYFNLYNEYDKFINTLRVHYGTKRNPIRK